MNWDYLAGLFDGDGSVAIGLRDHKQPIFRFEITSSSEILNQELIKFLNSRKIRVSQTFQTNHLGSSRHLTVQSLGGLTKIVRMLIPRVVEKREQLLILRDAIRVRSDLLQLDSLRRQLHGLSKKGPKTLKSWVIFK